MDFCSIANVSIFVMDERLHGFYMHGQNPSGKAEGNAKHLADCFNLEE